MMYFSQESVMALWVVYKKRYGVMTDPPPPRPPLQASDDKMRIPVIITFYTAGKSGSDTIHREKCRVNFDEDTLSWSKKKLHEVIE